MSDVDDWTPVASAAPAAPALTVTPSASTSPPVDDWAPVSSAAPDASATPQGPLTNNGNESWGSGIAKGLGTAAVRGAAMVAGLPGDLNNMSKMATAGVDKLVRGGSYSDAMGRVNAAEAAQQQHSRDTLGTAISAPIDSQAVESGIENKTGVGRYDPSSTTGRIAQATASTVMGGILNPEGAGARVAESGIKGLANVSKGAIAANAVAGAGGQAGLETAQALGGDEGWQTIGGLVGGFGGTLAHGAMSSTAAKYGASGRDAAVGNAVLDSASNPQAVRDGLVNYDDAGAMVAGSKPSTGELLGDGGLGKAQDMAETADPARWNAREDANNSARALSLNPNGANDADPMATVRSFGDHIDAIDAAGQGVRDDMTAAHDAAVQKLNDTYSAGAADRTQSQADFVAQQQQGVADAKSQRQDALTAGQADQTSSTSAARDAMTQAFSDRLQKAQADAQAGNASIGAPVSAEVAGTVLQDHLQAARDVEKGRRDSLYKSINPDENLLAVQTPAMDAVNKIKASIDPTYGVQPSGVEADLHKSILGGDHVVPFSSLQKLDSRVGAALADAKRNPNAADPEAVIRLGKLKSATMDAINNAVEHQRAYEARQVSAGSMRYDDSIGARIDEWVANAGLHPEDDSARATGTAGRPAPAGAGRGREDGAGNGGSGSPAGSARGAGEPPAFNPERVTRPTRPQGERPQDLASFIKSNGGMQDVGGDLKSMGLDHLVAKRGEGYHPDKMREAAAEAGYLGADTDHAVAHTDVNDLLDAVSTGEPVHSVHDGNAVHAWKTYDENLTHYNENRDTPVNKPAGDKRMREEVPLSAYEDELAGERAEPGDHVSPNMDQSGAGERLAAAKAQHVIYAQYKDGAVGKALDKDGYGRYTTRPELIAKTAIRDFTTTKEILDKAKGNQPQAAAQVGELLTNELRAKMKNGTLFQADLDAWKAKNAGSIRALRAIDPEYGKGFTSVAKANESLVALGQERDLTIRNFERDAATKAAETFAAKKKGNTEAGAADAASATKAIADRRAADKVADTAAKAERDAGIAKSRGERDAAVSAAKSKEAEARALPGAKLAGKTDPTEVAHFMGNLIQSPTDTRAFMAHVKNDPAALAGARKALVAHMVAKVTGKITRSDGEKGLANNALQTVLADDKMNASLKMILPPEDYNNWRMVGADLDRRDALASAARTKGSQSASRMLAPLLEAGKKNAGHAAAHGAGGFAAAIVGEKLIEHLMAGNYAEAGMAVGAGAAGLALKKTVGGAISREKAARAAALMDALENPERARHYVRAADHDNQSARAAWVNSMRRQMTAIQAVR